MRHREKPLTDPDTIRRIREVVGHARREIEGILREPEKAGEEKSEAKTE